MKRTISIPTNDRPNALGACVDAICRNKSWKNWEFIVTAEPKAIDLTALTRIYVSARLHVFRNPFQFGINLNTFMANWAAFHLGSDFNLYIEDDCLVSPDALDLAEAYSNQPVTSAGLALMSEKSDPSKPNDVVNSTFCGLLGMGFACHRSQWNFFKQHWFSAVPEIDNASWDLAVERSLLTERKTMARPSLSRSVALVTTGSHTASTDMIPKSFLQPFAQTACEQQFNFI